MKLNSSKFLIAFTLGIILTSGAFIQTAQADPQPHMVSALEKLQGARHQLEIAMDDKGGHRVAAIAAIDNAISEVKMGIAAGN